MISVCMTTYNGERFLKEQLDSILQQLSVNDEIVISDDGSTDGTLDIVKSYDDSRIKLLHHNKNKQKYTFSYTTVNMQNALRHANGEYIFMADQDDVWLPDKVQIMLQYCRDYDLVLADCLDVDANLQILCDSHFKLYNAKSGILHNLIGPCCYLGSNMCFRRSLLNVFMDIPENVPHDLWIGMMTELRGKLILIPEKTMLYRRHETNVSGMNNRLLRGRSNVINIQKNNHSLFFKLKYRLDIVHCLIRRIIFKQ